MRPVYFRVRRKLPNARSNSRGVAFPSHSIPKRCCRTPTKFRNAYTTHEHERICPTAFAFRDDQPPDDQPPKVDFPIRGGQTEDVNHLRRSISSSCLVNAATRCLSPSRPGRYGEMIRRWLTSSCVSPKNRLVFLLLTSGFVLPATRHTRYKLADGDAFS